jgi:tetratricopeptide (TPR) repeat protein
MSKDEAILTPDITAKNISKQYIQDLFRFFKLYPQRADFSDMLQFSLSMHRTFMFDILSGNEDFKSSIAEYYFSKGYYVQALELFEVMQSETHQTAALYQKIGYSYQQTSQFEKALSAYLKADMIQPDDLWTARKTALCYRLSGNYSKALEYYLHADFLNPDHKPVMLQIGHCYIELSKYKEALNIFFKLDALVGDDVKVWRGITWSSFVLGNLQQADYYSKKLLVAEPNAHDYLNAGHIAWCQRRLSDAITLYRKSLEMQQNNRSIFLEALNDDKTYLIANGIDNDEIPLMLDALDS